MKVLFHLPYIPELPTIKISAVYSLVCILPHPLFTQVKKNTYIHKIYKNIYYIKNAF